MSHKHLLLNVTTHKLRAGDGKIIQMITLPPSATPGEEDQSYSPQKALSLALTDWLQVFLNPDQPGGTSSPNPNYHTELH